MAGLAAVSLSFVIVGLPLQARLGVPADQPPLFVAVFVALILSLTSVGGYIALRVPGNPIGWLMATAGMTTAVAIFGGTYVEFNHVLAGDRLPFAVVMAWLSSWLFVATLGALAVFLPLLFPTGRFLSRRWAAIGWIGVAGAVLSAAGSAFAPGPLSSAPWLANPLGIEPLADLLAGAATVGNTAAPFVFLGAIVSVILRFRRADALERHQLKWFAFVSAIAIVGLGLAIPNNGPIADAGWAIGLLALAMLPVAIGLAILRYRLYDIDRIISRTVSWAIVSGLLVAVFVGALVGLQAAFAGATGESSLAVAASTLVTFSVFQPVRRRVQRAVDRRFNRARYDAQRTVEDFAGRVRAEMDLATLGSTLSATADDAVHPTSAAVWLRHISTARHSPSS